MPKKTKKKTPEKSRAVVHSDPLSQYLAHISAFQLLTPEQERQMTTAFHETHDPKLAYELTVRNLRLVVKIALDYRRAWKNLLDLIQEGNIGLMTAIQKFDPYRQTRLSTYAAWWIRAYILKFIMSNWRLIKIGNTQAERKLFYNLRREQDKLLSEGFAPGPKLIAERLNVPEKDVIEMSKRLGTSELSLDYQPTFVRSSSGPEDGPSLAETLSDQKSPLDEILADEELIQVVRTATQEFRKTLKPREIILLERRILTDEPSTLQQIGDEFHVSRERVRQLEVRLMEKLKEFISKKFPDLKPSFDKKPV